MSNQRLSQVIAVESGVKNRATASMSEVYKQVQHPALFEGFNKKYQPLAEDSERFPDENKKVQMTALEVINTARRTLSELFDVTATKDYGNTAAKADIAVDGTIIVANVPVPYLLFLEKQLTDLHTLVSKIPVLDSADSWSVDPNSGLHRTEPTKTTRTKKVQKSLVLLPPTDKHPGQAQLITEDQAVGTWDMTKFSGAMPKPSKDALLERIEKLQKAVKFAREEANATSVPERKISNQVFDWLLG